MAEFDHPVGVDRELVAIVNVEGDFSDLEEGVQAEAVPLVMEFGPVGWRVASIRKSDMSDRELMRQDPRDERPDV